MASSYRLTLENYLAGLELKADLLIDIGGSQLELAKRVKQFDVKKYVIADLPNPHKDSRRPDIAWDMNESIYDDALSNILDKKIAKYRSSADLITCFEVAEYIWNPVAFFSNIAWLLRQGGIAYVSFPSFYPLHQPIADDALRYMPGGIKKLSDWVGLDIINMKKRRPETSALQGYFSAERLRAAKDEDHAFMGFIVEFKKREQKYESSI